MAWPWHRTLVPMAVWVLAGAVLGGEPFDYFANSWSVVGLRDYVHGARITPANEVMLAGKAKLSIRFGNRLTPLSRRQTKTCLDGWLPVILVSAQDGDVRYDFTFWATPLPSVKDWRKAFDWPTEGENFLVWVLAKTVNTGQQTAQARLEATCSGRGRKWSFAWSLDPGRSAEAVLRVPYAPVREPAAFEREDPKVWLERTVAYWRGLMAKAARIEVPSKKATEALLAAHVCQLLVSDHGELHGGEGFYDTFYIRDGAYQVMELEEAGLDDAAAKAIAFFLRRQRPDGRFETQRGQLDANGQALWAIWQYYKIAGDRAWLEKAYPRMLRAAEWVRKARRQAPPGSPFAGLLPAAPADGEHLWDGKHHIVGYDFWNLRGLLCTADAAKALGRVADAARLQAEAADYRAAIDAAWKRTGLPHFPPSWEKEGTHWGNTETLWPTEIFPPDDPRVVALIRHARTKHGGGFLEGTIRWTGRPGVVHPYLSAYTTMASLVRGESERVVEDFHWYLLHSTATHAFPEGIFYRRRFAWFNTIPHPTGASNYALMLRHMLVHERGDDLHLLPAVPDWWLAEGRSIVVERAPTHFGPLSFRTRGTARGVELSFQPPRRNPPARIILHLPESRPLVGTLKGVTVVVRKDQGERWDFPTVVRAYLEQAPQTKAIPGLVQLPVGPLRPDQCVLLDIGRLANTDPFTAPFGVPQAKGSRYLFTGLPVGVQVVAGVPFRIADPAKNGGKGLVVLHSPKAPKHIRWPRQVEIPVGQRGKRLFFLGNVHGWAPEDEGTGKWGALAEYLIVYADGTTQTVPLIAGRTTDDWILPPTATEARCGLTGRSWHLNVLGVDLRPVRVEKIVFRDLGTPAAPVLVAVTLEK